MQPTQQSALNPTALERRSAYTQTEVAQPPLGRERRHAQRPAKGTLALRDDPLWYKDAVIYQVHVKAFFDANNDGVGDFPGLIDKLDYIAALGVNTIWLLPFYPSPRRDDGYDIAEYKGVHQDYGTMDDVKRFIAEAHRRNLRVITELVINHTSDQHPWFQRARHAEPGSDERNFYVWSDNDQAYAGTRIIFLDTEKSNWTWDPVANAYFWHRFYSHQPDLNFDNPAVLEAVLDIMAFWLDVGIDGLRLDAVPYLIEREGTSNENLPETHVILKKIRAKLDQDYPGRMLLAEANMWPEDVQPYFGDGNECHMAFHFPLMPRMYMALAQEDRFPITDILRQTPDIPADCQWAIFLRNHDELTLEMVTDRERDYLWNFYASDRRARINLGIRRRLAPLLERDRRRIELLNSFLLSMPGTPVLYYGDEIGMGDNIHLGDRDGVRTPMQRTPDRNGGFSRANPATLVLPAIMDPLYGFQAVNVEAQEADPYSLLNSMRRLLEVRRQHRAFGRGTLKLLSPSNRKILAYLREYQDPNVASAPVETILCVANVSRTSQAVELDLAALAGRVPVEMLGGTAFPPITQGYYQLTLAPFGFYWFVLTAAADGLVAPIEQMPDFATLVLRNGIEDLWQGAARQTLERDTLPQYLPKRRWYAGKQHQLHSVQLSVVTPLPVPQAYLQLIQNAHTDHAQHAAAAKTAVATAVSSTTSMASATALGAASNLISVAAAQAPVLLAELLVTTDGGEARYLLPLGFTGEDTVNGSLPAQLALARVRRDRRVGMLTDAFTLDPFVFAVLDLLQQNSQLPCADGVLNCVGSATLRELTQSYATTLPEIRRLSAEQSNSSLVIGDAVVLKVLRRIVSGVHPGVEMGRYLTQQGYPHTPPMLGEITRIGADGTPHTLIELQRFMHNQGDGWQWTLNTLTLAMQSDGLNVVSDSTLPVAGPLEELQHFMRTLGQRLAALHAVLARPSDDAAFNPQPVDAATARSWGEGAQRQIEAAFEILHTQNDSADLMPVIAALLTRHDALIKRVVELAASAEGTQSIRIHGDFHLGQVLVISGDVMLVDFEGEPVKSLEQRRAKSSPWRDVAGALRSFDYLAAFAAQAGPADLGAAALARKQQVLQRFLPDAQAAFLQGYLAGEQALDVTAELAGAEVASMAVHQPLLDLFLLEKAAYEICYEAANRPAWLGVPARGLLRIAERVLGELG